MEPFVALDWGTTRVRAALIDSNGKVVEERLGESGVGDLDHHGFEARFGELTQGWKFGFAIACGMIGSRQGWVEASYVQCPTELPELGEHLAHLPTKRGSLFVVPGLSINRFSASHDVMRGEETQLLGLIGQEEAFTGTIVLPGTHSKWVSLQKSVVTDFLSYLTGDLFEAISKHTLLSHSIDHGRSQWNEASFLRGVETALECDGVIWSLLFGIRADSLMEGDGDNSQGEYLSGLLIGSEFASAKRDGFEAEELVIVGGEQMISIYESAAKTAGHKTRSYKGTDLVWPALIALARSLQKTGV